MRFKQFGTRSKLFCTGVSSENVYCAADSKSGRDAWIAKLERYRYILFQISLVHLAYSSISTHKQRYFLNVFIQSQANNLNLVRCISTLRFSEQKIDDAKKRLKVHDQIR